MIKDRSRGCLSWCRFGVFGEVKGVSNLVNNGGHGGVEGADESGLRGLLVTGRDEGIVVLAGLGRGWMGDSPVLEGCVEGDEGETSDGDEEEGIGMSPGRVGHRADLAACASLSPPSSKTGRVPEAAPALNTTRARADCKTRPHLASSPQPPSPVPEAKVAMDVRHSHGSTVHVVRACCEDDAADLIAVGGDHSVEIIQIVRRASFTSAFVSRVAPRKNLRATPSRAFTLAPVLLP